jgi:hypothetical protein
MLKLVSWNLAHRPELWRALLDEDADIALVQEACEPPPNVAGCLDVDHLPWSTGLKRLWRTAVVRLNPKIDVHRYAPCSISDAREGELAVSRLGTLAAADARDPDTGETFTLISMYSCWERPHVSTGSSWIYADASAHRLISDLSVFVGAQHGHHIVAVGDLNILYGHGEYGSQYWAARYQTIFERMIAIGLQFVGPQAPSGRQANPWPSELPLGSRNVPTYHTNRQTPTSASRQLDFVFASTHIAHRVNARALNQPEEWGSSDHCRIRVNLTAPGHA